MAAFHLLLALTLIGVVEGSNPRALIDDGLWPVKLLLWAGLIVGSAFIPSVALVYYSWIARFGAAIFIVIQCYLLVDWAFDLSNSMASRADDYSSKGNEKWYYLLVATAITLNVATAVGIILLYVYFAPGHGTRAF